MKVHLVLEGALEVPLAQRLLTFCGHESGFVYRLNGARNVKGKAHRYHTLTKTGAAVLVLSDFMDANQPCIPMARHDYLDRYLHEPSPKFLLRFAVQELESWILADRKGASDYLHVPLSKIPAQPESLSDPKLALVNLARKSKSSLIRECIVPDEQHGGVVAPSYVEVMSRFLVTSWSPRRAQENSESLRRCITALASLV